MPKTNTRWSEKIYLSRLREGRGKGEYESYKPWVTVQEIPSQGMSSRIPGEKTKRLHHLFSRNETAFFYLLDNNEDVLDIREQYPLLDVLDTVRIAERAGVRHPRDNKSGYPYVVTSDFYIVTRSGVKVRSVKMREDLRDLRVLEKQEVERRYWKERGVDWKIVTDTEINYQKASNISWIRNRAKYLCEFIPDGTTLAEALFCFCEAYRCTVYPVSTIAGDIEEEFGLPPGTGICVFAKALYDGLIDADISSRIDTTAVRVVNGRR